jgi:hypothetical protein
MLENAIVSELIALAEKEDWDSIDKKIPEVCNDGEVLNWAYFQGIFSKTDNVRDLGASILEKAEWPKQYYDTIKHYLIGTLGTEKHQFAKFRMACALAAHDEWTEQVLEVLKAAPPEVKEISDKYLKKHDIQ